VYTSEFKLAAAQRVKDGQRLAVVARELHVSEQTLRNWMKAEQPGKLYGTRAKAVTPEQMELSRLRAENKGLRMKLSHLSRLRAENKRLQKELEIARIAAGCFVKDLL